MVKRFEIYLINLDAELTRDPKITRPGVIVSPDEMNDNIDSVLIAPLSSTLVKYPTRVPTEFLNSERFVILDQIRPVEKSRLVKQIGTLDDVSSTAVVQCLAEMFAA